MSHKTWIFCIALLLLGTAALIARPVAANTQPQVTYQTPTARPDGRVIYIVQPNDVCMRIQLLTNNNTTVEQLRSLNKLDQNCTISPGQELLLMVVTPVASPTPNPNASPTPLLPTPTAVKGDGRICVVLFDDVNGNAVHETTEKPLGGGAISISDRLAQISKTINTTDAPDVQLCEDVPEGEYNISVAIPSGYNPTKSMNAVAQVQAGDQAIFEFGAQAGSQVQNPPDAGGAGSTDTPQTDNSLPLAVVGGLLILGGIGLGGYILFTRRRPAG